ncbi:unnamed protein product [Blepharisma stoltei]|uniref:Uncharacterized protein n=1 Tax=Blepharisma stoltei TaxID=1481888 RepID=A0AAU9I369_9CILI|nr:unnamed protein product [Blepharisma stoltei]
MYLKAYKAPFFTNLATGGLFWYPGLLRPSDIETFISVEGLFGIEVVLSGHMISEESAICPSVMLPTLIFLPFWMFNKVKFETNKELFE